MVIAHEITHAFDNSGAKYDEKGNATNWWTEEDYAAFQKLCDRIVTFYDGQESAPGIVTNGSLTLTENIADIGGVVHWKSPPRLTILTMTHFLRTMRKSG